jgi:hypothetical protein
VLIIVIAFWLAAPSSLMDPGDPVFAQFKLLILPVATLTLVMLAYTSRMTRTSMIEVMEKNFVRTARLKGIGERQVIVRHALPNALLPTITIVAMNIGWLMGSLVVVETVFSYPGLGRMMVFAVSNRDVPTLQMTVLVAAGIYFCQSSPTSLRVPQSACATTAKLMPPATSTAVRETPPSVQDDGGAPPARPTRPLAQVIVGSAFCSARRSCCSDRSSRHIRTPSST